MQPLVADPERFRPDPHAGFAHYRPKAAVIQLGMPLPLVTRFSGFKTLVTDQFSRQMETEALGFLGVTQGALHRFYAGSMLTSNAPRHPLRRRPAQRSFLHREIQNWRPRIRALVHEMIDAVEKDGAADLVTQFSNPMPARLIAEFLGAPIDDAPAFAAMVHRMTKGLGPFRQDQFPAIEQAADELIAYTARLIADRRAEPKDDFISGFIARADEEGDLSAEEIVIQLVTLFIAGSDTTRFGFTLLVSLLLQHREQWEAVCANPALAAPAVTEALRYEPPVGSIGRVMTADTEIDGIALRAGQVVSLSILSAQRDEAVFADPQRFDIHRTDHPRWSISFGHGAHRCLGEALARAEMEEALSVFAERLLGLHLAEPPEAPRGQGGIRGVPPVRIAW